MLLSVIVPAYNAGEYLKPCLESILALPIEKEVILVDDGSTDGAVGRLSIRDERLVMISQTNQGVSAARNTGLTKAKGEWVWFVDADDVVCDNLNHNANHNANLTPEGVMTIGNNLNDVALLVLPFVWEEKGAAQRFDAHDGEIPYNLWRCWFQRKQIEKYGVRFTPGRKYAEDQEFILKYLLRTSCKTQAVEGPTYHYTMRLSGAMMRPDTKKTQRTDLWNVLWSLFWNAFLTGNLLKKWVILQHKRLIKNLIII